MNSRLRLSVALSTAAAAAVLAFGCGGGGGDSGSSVADPATAAPADTPVFIDATVRPAGDQKTSIEDLVSKVTDGKVDPGSALIKQIDQSIASDPQTKGITYEDDIAPWLGEKVGISLSDFDGQNFNGVGATLQVTDTGAAGDFYDKIKDQKDVTSGTYKGFDYTSSSGDSGTFGVVDNFFVIGQDLATYKSIVDTIQGGDSLDADTGYKDALATASDSSVADVYVDVGGLIKAAGSQVDPQILKFYNALGVDFSNSTAFASLVPSSDKVEMDISTDAGTGLYSSGDPSKLLGSFPQDSFAAFASADVGKQITKALDGIDKVGFPPEVPPGALKSALARAGVNLGQITSRIGDVGVFVDGSSIVNIGGALVVTSGSAKDASDSVNQITVLLKKSGARGFSVLKGRTGFQVLDPQLPRPLVVTATGDRIAIGLGLPQTLKAATASGPTLASDPTFKEAESALGDSKIAGFVNLAPIAAFAQLAGDPSVQQALPYLQKFSYLAFGSGTSGKFTTSKIILALGK